MSESLAKGPNQKIEDTGLGVISSGTTELAPTRSAAAEQFEIQSAIVLARRFPRNEDQAFALLMKACSRTSFAEAAEYSFPRGGSTVSGPSVNLAREAARVWGNIRYGLTILRDDEETRQIEGWAWDLETNTKVTAQDDFRKVIQRKKKGGGTEWVKPDERDLRELTNRRGAILVRNCILQLLPRDLIEDAQGKAGETLKTKAEQDPEGAKKKLILAFADLNVTPEMLEKYLGHPLAQCSPAEIANLRKVYASIKDGNSTWEEYLQASNGSGNGGGARAVGTPTAKKPDPEPSAPHPSSRPAGDLDAMDALAAVANFSPIELQGLSSKMFNGKAPAQLNDAEFLTLQAYLKNGPEGMK